MTKAMQLFLFFCCKNFGQPISLCWLYLTLMTSKYDSVLWCVSSNLLKNYKESNSKMSGYNQFDFKIEVIFQRIEVIFRLL